MSMTVDDYEWTQNLSQKVCGVITSGISPSVTSSTSRSEDGIVNEKGTDESLSSPKVRSLGS